MSCLRSISFWILLSLISTGQAEPRLTAPNKDAQPLDQNKIFANSCGPVCLYHALLFGGKKWRSILEDIPRDSPKKKLRYIVGKYGMRKSRHAPDTHRWKRKSGISAYDLADVAEEIRELRWLPHIKLTNHFQSPKQSNVELLATVHKRLSRSLKKQLPPIITIHRYIQSDGQWEVHQAHFVTLISLPKSIPKGATSFPVTYVDSWGGKIYQGHLRAPQKTYPPAPKKGALFDLATGPAAVIIDFPKTSVGKSSVPKGITTQTILTGIIGAH